ncbi:MAG: DUF1844 domain-containing protein [Lentisphaerota bacterium]
MKQNEMTSEELNKSLFAHLVISLAGSAMQHMGKIINPAVGKPEMNLEAAQATIDMIDMLEVKTKGNLDAEEQKLLKDALTSLKLNFVESAEAAPAPPPPPPKTHETRKNPRPRAQGPQGGHKKP